MTRYVNPPALAAPHGYSHGVVIAPGAAVLFVAGQVAWDRDAQIVSDDFAEQFDRALANVLEVVTAAGGTPESIGRMIIFVTSTDEYAAARGRIGERYRARMGRHYPAMTLVEVQALLEPGAKVEIEALACLEQTTPRPA
jgi:enamine deaminase RidA (YjgF/YER057c/UK114 family)